MSALGQKRMFRPAPIGVKHRLRRPTPMANRNHLIRVATEADLQALAEIHIASWQDAYKGIIPDAFLAGRFRRGFSFRVEIHVRKAPRQHYRVGLASRRDSRILLRRSGRRCCQELIVRVRDIRFARVP
jgi:hypothetical protein